jgi:hypothetical protein
MLESHPSFAPVLSSVRTAPSMAFIHERERQRLRELLQRNNGTSAPVSVPVVIDSNAPRTQEEYDLMLRVPARRALVVGFDGIGGNDDAVDLSHVVVPESWSGSGTREAEVRRAASVSSPFSSRGRC